MAPPPGFDASHVSPQDAIVTVRSLRRRFAEAFAQAEGPGELAVAGPDGRTPIDHGAATATALERIGSALRQVMVSERPGIELPDGAGAPGLAAGLAADPVLARLEDATERLASALSGVHGEAWLRTGVAGVEVSALDLARLAVKIGIDHLHAAERALGGSAQREV